jgi:oxygen-independent coproporphyrinogen-3 oxidase
MLARSDDYPPKDGLYQDYLYFEPTPMKTIQDAWRNTIRLMRAGEGPENVILYIHWPFCISQCTYCFCSMTVQRHRKEAEVYLKSLMREMDAFKDIFRGVKLWSVYIGGGTPTYITEEALDALFKHVHDCFEIREGAEIYVEASPATLTKKKMDVLKRHGVNRMTMGLQTRDEAVLKTVNRAGQDQTTVDRAWTMMAQTEGIIKDVDLMVGLEGQTRLSFVKDLVWSIRRNADIIHIQSFDPRRQTLFSRARKKKGDSYWPEMEMTVKIAERLLEQAGYGITHYNLQKGVETSEEKILSDDPFEMSSVLALGKHGKAHAFGSAWYQHPSVKAGTFNAVRVPPFQYIPADLTEEMRCYMIRSLCLHERIDLGAFKKLFGCELKNVRAILKPLQELADWGKVRIGEREVRLLAVEPAERLVWLKHLYREEVLESVIRAHYEDYKKFKKRFKEDPEDVLAALKQKAEARTYHLVYYKGFAKKRREQKEAEAALAVS